MEQLRIYRVKDHYIRFLHSRDSRVPYNKGNRRPYVGIVLYVGSYQYFVPMESPKPSHTTMKAGKHILKLNNGQLGLLGFNNMIPVPQSALIQFDINNEADQKYSNLLKQQANFVNRNKADILNRASQTYYAVATGKNKFLVSISCNFKSLEKACNEYKPYR